MDHDDELWYISSKNLISSKNIVLNQHGENEDGRSCISQEQMTENITQKDSNKRPNTKKQRGCILTKQRTFVIFMAREHLYSSRLFGFLVYFLGILLLLAVIFDNRNKGRCLFRKSFKQNNTKLKSNKIAYSFSIKRSINLPICLYTVIDVEEESRKLDEEIQELAKSFNVSSASKNVKTLTLK